MTLPAPGDSVPSASTLRVAVGGSRQAPARALAEALRGREHDISVFSEIGELVHLALAREFDVALVFTEREDEARKLLHWFVGRRPSTSLYLVTTTDVGASLEHAAQGRARVVVWDEVDVHAQVEELERLGGRHGFVGRFIEIELFDYVQMVALNGGDKLIRIETLQGSGYVWFQHGDIVHAEFGESRGEEAFYEMFAAGSGAFGEVYFQDPRERSIRGSSTHLLMEASRRQDEGLLKSRFVGPHPLDAKVYAPMRELELHQKNHVVSSGEGSPDYLSPRSGTSLNLVEEELYQSSSAGDSDVWVVVVDDDAPPGAQPLESLDDGIPANEFDFRETGELEVSGEMDWSFDDQELRVALMRQFFEYDGVLAAAVCSRSGEVLAQDLGEHESELEHIESLLRGVGRLSKLIRAGVAESVILRRSKGVSLLLVGMGNAVVSLVLDTFVNPEGLRNEILGLHDGAAS